MSEQKPGKLGLPRKAATRTTDQPARKPVRPPSNRQAALARKPAAAEAAPARSDKPPRSHDSDDKARKGVRPATAEPAERRPRPPRPFNGPNTAAYDPERSASRPARHPGSYEFGPSKPRPAAAVDEDPNAPLRLSRRLAELGLCSRREADEYIERGWVTVDGVVVNELGTRVLRSQDVALTRQAHSKQNQRVTILMHKPIGYVSGQAEDGYRPASVLITPENRWLEDDMNREFKAAQLRGLAPAGRLDIDSTGLLVFTQDGRIARQLIGDDSEVEKEYLVRVEGPLSHADLARLNHGLSLDGVALRPAQVSWANAEQLRFILREGRKRQIRRMCEMVGLEVLALKRVRIGKIMLGDLPMGQWRYLSETEGF